MRRVGKRPDGDGANPMHRRTVHGRIRVLPSARRTSALVALAALFGTAGNLQADESALPRLQAIAAAEQAAEKRWRDSQRARREYQRRSAAAHARMRMQGVSTMHASTPSPPNGAMCLAPGVEPARFSPLPSGTSRTTGGSSTARAVISSRNSASGTTQTTGASSLGLRRSPQPHPILDSATPHVPMRERRVPFLPSASREPAQRGILRLASHDSRATVVSIAAFDDTGRRFGPIALPLQAGHTAELSSSDIEQGNPVKGLPRGIGAGQGDWRLVVRSPAELHATAYAETAEGLRSQLARVPESPNGSRSVPLFPSAQADAPGILRLSNPSAEPAAVAITARNDTGQPAEVRLAVPPGASRWLTAFDMESGRGVAGALGNAAGHWRLAIHAPPSVHALALSTNATGTLTSLSSSQRTHSAAFDPNASALGKGLPGEVLRGEGILPSHAPQGAPVPTHATLPTTAAGSEALLRVVNHSSRSGAATLHMQANGSPRDSLTLHLAADAAATLSSADLEFGNPAKGLPQGFGIPTAGKRAIVRSNLELDAIPYLRAADGTVAPMHDVAPRAGASNVHALAMFPAGGSEIEGRLHLKNRSDAPATVRIKGVDDEGRASQPATLTLPAKAAQTLTSSQLAWGAPELDGWLGAGRGHWRLSVWSNAPLDVTALLASRTGGLANISAASSSISTDQRLPHPIGDLNGDGMDDVLLRHVDGRWMYYPMNGRTPIESERGTVALERSANWQLAGIGDMDGDGKDDILLRNADGRWKGHLMDGKAVLDSGSIAGLPTDPIWNVAGLGDLDGNGKTDVVLRHPDGQWLHAPLDGLTVAPNIAVEPNLTKSAKWSVAGIADLNGDGRDDILLRHEDGRWHYYPMNGSLSGPGRGSVSGVTNSLDWKLAGLGDLNGDGRDDILLRHVEGRWTHHPMNGRHVMAGKGGVSLTPNTAWRMAGLGDLNGDGNDDALLRHEDGRWTYYPLNGRTILAGRGTAGITRNPDWSTKGPEPGPDEAEADAPYDEDETAESVFHASIASIVETKCATCHRDGGVSGNTRLVFATGSSQQTANLSIFEDFLANVDEGGTLILNKVQGVSHGGGIQLAAGTEGFAAMERFLALLQGGPDGGPSVTPATLFDGVKMEPARSTLRRAAIVFAGRIPTDAEYESIKSGGIASLRKAIRRLMQGQGFHDFLIRGANDRLLTDRNTDLVINEFDTFVDYTNKRHRLSVEAGEVHAQSVYEWVWPVQYGARRSPLELIARVAERDLPYTEVLTADYVMANPWAAEAYGTATAFNDVANPNEFQPSDILSYYRRCEGQSLVTDSTSGPRIEDSGPCATEYPHAGVLGTKVFLQRYPTTATNRNRARSRWTYYHFLGLDIEKSAARTTDPEALADTNNPTMHNPACTVCHRVLDPVAGAFQDYGDTGLYRDQWGGLDSLDDDYKRGLLARLSVAGDRFDVRETFSVPVDLDEDASLVIRHHRNNGCGDGTCGRDLRIDRLAVHDHQGALVDVVEWSELDEHCEYDGQYNEGTGDDDHYQWWGWGCATIPVDVPRQGRYTVEITLWADQAGGEVTWFELGATLYHDGDTWYRDMRPPGFDGKAVQGPDSLQWLARRIVADARFAEATVKFWWPAVMGSDVVEPPSEGDPDFQGRLLASSAQAAEVERLTGAFRRGLGGGKRYNLKDLLAEIAISKWFRAASATEFDPIRNVALAVAGARRLLTPEEISRKTVALTGFDWRRHHEGVSQLGQPSNWTNAEWEYGLLYGGIDSDGITERGRDLTSVMAGVSRRHAAEISCPVVMKDLYLVAAPDRKLLGGIDPTASPGGSNELSPSAEKTVREKLVELHDKMLGVQVDAPSPDIQAAFDLFIEVWNRARVSEDDDFRQLHCKFHADDHYFDGILDVWLDDEDGRRWDWDRVNDFIWRETDMPDPHGLARTWMVILAYLMTDPRYLHL